MSYQSLGGVYFYRDPLNATIPEAKKTVSVVNTFSGSAIFQWPVLLQGSIVVLKWDWVLPVSYTHLTLPTICSV